MPHIKGFLTKHDLGIIKFFQCLKAFNHLSLLPCKIDRSLESLHCRSAGFSNSLLGLLLGLNNPILDHFLNLYDLGSSLP